MYIYIYTHTHTHIHRERVVWRALVGSAQAVRSRAKLIWAGFAGIRSVCFGLSMLHMRPMGWWTSTWARMSHLFQGWASKEGRNPRKEAHLCAVSCPMSRRWRQHLYPQWSKHQHDEDYIHTSYICTHMKGACSYVLCISVATITLSGKYVLLW